MEQRTTEWFEARRGKFTASGIATIMGGTQSSINKLIEDIQREIDEGPGGWLRGGDFMNAAMQHGVDNEPRAIGLFEIIYGVEVEPVGFMLHPDLPFVGASPDGLFTGKKGPYTLEVKCPYNLAIHHEHRTYGLPSKYVWQVHCQSWVTGRPAVFVSYHPKMSGDLQLYSEIVPIDETRHAQMRERCEQVWDMVQRDDRIDTNSTTDGAVPSFF